MTVGESLHIVHLVPVLVTLGQSRVLQVPPSRHFNLEAINPVNHSNGFHGISTNREKEERGLIILESTEYY